MDENFSNAKESATDISKCPSCGANLTFSSNDQCLMCEHCGTKVEIDMSHTSQEQDFEKLFEVDNSWGEETIVYRCDNCGAKQVISKKEIALPCPFCGTTNVVETEDLVGLKPNAILPFLFDSAKACEYVVKWARKKIFAPSAFKKSVHPEEIGGNYSPAFTFDSVTVSNYKGRLGKSYYVTKRVNGRTVQERKVRYFNVGGVFGMNFDDLLVQASDVISQKNINKIEPFDTNHSQEYSNDFMHGYTATQYTKDGKECWNDAKGYMAERIRKGILSKYDHDVVDYLDVSTEYNDITYKYVLLPLYIGHCLYSQKNYNFFVNGTNGKVAGKTPISPLRVMIAIFIILLIFGAGVFAYLNFNKGGNI